MSFLIAVSGKGGVGKTTVAALLINRLIARHCSPVLAVDADPNSCLDQVLGVQAAETVGRVREKARDASSSGAVSGIAKQQLLEMKISESLVESENFDLIAMGRSEGPGCYCYANNVLKSVITEIASHYPYVVLDNEAGLENLSRRIVQQVNLLVLVSDPSKRGLETLRRLRQLAGEMGIHYDRLAIVVNRMRPTSNTCDMEDLQNDTGADMLVEISENEELSVFGESGRNLLELSESNVALKSIDLFLDEAVAETQQITKEQERQYGHRSE